MEEIRQLADAVKATDGTTVQQKAQIDAQVGNVEDSYASLQLTAGQIAVSLRFCYFFICLTSELNHAEICFDNENVVWKCEKSDILFCSL